MNDYTGYTYYDPYVVNRNNHRANRFSRFSRFGRFGGLNGCRCNIKTIHIYASIFSAIVLVSISITFICLYVSNRSNIQKLSIFLHKFEEIDIDKIKKDINIVSNSMDQIQEIFDAMRLIPDKNQFIQETMYLLDYACKIVNCTKSRII